MPASDKGIHGQLPEAFAMAGPCYAESLTMIF
jgi:hypothetical protein